METQLHKFCHDFDKIVVPLDEPLRNAVDIAVEEADLLPVGDAIPSLQDNRHKLELLTEKIRRQQAYVLIFGPLKSGKSTLMNAISGSYVSEVSALPGYPCLVYVSDAEKPAFEITRYDGSSEKVKDAGRLRQCVVEAHQRLSEEIRRFEAGTEQTKKERKEAKADKKPNGKAAPAAPDNAKDEFDPAVHYSRALRKVDVRVPAGDLKESGAVLVDTPGLYSRMKFGYDRMTRDFRDTAACAVFVVKTDNLFLEQVFSEFEELLQLFDRIFLVVNLDSNKKDLMPDGSLKASLEREDPAKIVESFEKLSMSAPLKAAAEEGRLRIYPVDLLQAASRRLRAAGPAPSTSASAAPSPIKVGGAKADGGRNGSGKAPSVADGFDTLRDDMMSYLNSSDYMTAFMNDSLRYAENILGSVTSLGKGTGVRKLHHDKLGLEKAVAHGEALQEALKKIGVATASDEQRAALVQDMRNRFRKTTGEANAKTGGNALSDIQWIVQNWFAGEESLEQLSSGHILELGEQALRQSSEAALGELKQISEDRVLPLPEDFLDQLKQASIDPKAIAGEVLESLEKPGTDMLHIDSPYDEIPVRKRLGDWFLLRTKASLRKRIFGPAEAPEFSVPSELKEARLGDAAQEYLETFYREAVSATLPVTLTRHADALWDRFAAGLIAGINEKAEELRASNADTLAGDKKKLDVFARADDAFSELEKAALQSTRAAGAIRKNFVAEKDDTRKSQAAAKPGSKLETKPETKAGKADKPKGSVRPGRVISS